MKTIWHHHMDSNNWTFDAYGATKEECMIAFAKGLRAHADKTGSDQSWVDECVSECEPHRVALGACYRDRETRL